MEEQSEGGNQRKDDRLKLELPVEAQVNSGGFKRVQIVDISPSGIQLWCDDIHDLEAYAGGGKVLEFEVRFRAKMAWCQPLEDDRSYLIGWEIVTEQGQDTNS